MLYSLSHGDGYAHTNDETKPRLAYRFVGYGRRCFWFLGYVCSIHRCAACLRTSLHVCISAHIWTDDFTAVRLDVFRSSSLSSGLHPQSLRTALLTLFRCRWSVDIICSRREIGSHRRIIIGGCFLLPLIQGYGGASYGQYSPPWIFKATKACSPKAGVQVFAKFL